ncbi:DUF3850 domain-containing protein [Lactobacillus sp. ESL0679]|uniref:DUF3850 domain-containing protein n=1 Tax=Lactobacillus sp. ESL0679 TaxID=2983209 RepID=UPI0023FA35CE|nr:DUF3850 domain-containing protein [Lactobacillus sp. ESL0679]MDF7683395.1 DUF3850 domain-containing protein [Lactobacillus sp. ESL0679]
MTEEKRIFDNGKIVARFDSEHELKIEGSWLYGPTPDPFTFKDLEKLQRKHFIGCEIIDVIGITKFWWDYCKPAPKMFELKIEPKYFKAQIDGSKQFEIRKDDHEEKFKVGDILRLREYENKRYTGHSLFVKVTFVTDYKQQNGYVVLGTKKLDKAW